MSEELTREERWSKIEDAVSELVERLVADGVIPGGRAARVAIGLLAAFRVIGWLK